MRIIASLTLFGNGKSWIPGVVFVASLALLLVGIAHYFPFIADDALISLRYTERLVEGKGLTWTDGHPVEGYSNLLWVLLCAVPAALGFELVDTSRVLGITSVAAILLILVLHYRGALERWSPFALCAIGLCATSGTLLVWSIGGLETALFAALLAVAVSALLRAIDAPELERHDVWTSSIALGLLCITRPDGALFVAVAYAAFWALRATSGLRVTWPDGVRFLCVPTALVGAQVAFRRLYYGEWVPNTALVKIALTPERVRTGWHYVSEGYLALMPLVLLVAACWVVQLWRDEPRRRVLLLTSLLFAWTTYLILIGGGTLPAFRHFAPIVVLGAFIIAETDRGEVPLLRGRLNPALSLVLSVALLAWFSAAQRTRPQNVRAKQERWQWNGKVVGTLLGTGFSKQQPLVAVTAAGCIPFWSRLPSLDMLGLNDYYLPRHPPPDFGTGPLAHELGSADYLLRRNPDLVVFHEGSPQLDFRTGRELAARPEFFERYVLVAMVGHDPHRYEAYVWVNQTSARVGIVRDGSRIRIPGYFFARAEGSTAELDESARLVLRLTKGSRVWFDVPDVDARSWELAAVDATSRSLDVMLVPSPKGARVVLESRDRAPIEVRHVDLARRL